MTPEGDTFIADKPEKLDELVMVMMMIIIILLECTWSHNMYFYWTKLFIKLDNINN